MKPVFADAFYFVALVNRADQHHSRAVAAARQLHGAIVTTEWILAEFADALAGSVSRRLVPQFIRDLGLDPQVRIVRASTEWFQRGLTLYGKRADKAWFLTDCISFAVMDEPMEPWATVQRQLHPRRSVRTDALPHWTRFAILPGLTREGYAPPR